LYNEASLPEALAAKAAHILFGIISLHPFIDGNKRTAYGTADIFLRLNGYSIRADPQESQKFIVRIAGGQTDEAEVKGWIRQRLKKL
jgi:death on curing protein